MTYDKISKVLTTEEYDASVASVENLNSLVTAFAVNLTAANKPGTGNDGLSSLRDRFLFSGDRF